MKSAVLLVVLLAPLAARAQHYGPPLPDKVQLQQRRDTMAAHFQRRRAAAERMRQWKAQMLSRPAVGAP